MKMLRILLILLFIFFTIGCQQEQQSSREQGVVEANDAYLNNFGAPPYETKGRAFARVGYLPLRSNPNLLRAIPLFLFTDQNQLGHILKKLTSGELNLPAESDIYDPFEKNINITIKSLEDGLLVLDLSATKAWSAFNLGAVSRVITETAVQFPDVSHVRLLLDGQPFVNMPKDGFVHNPEDLTEVDKPTLVDITGTWHKDEEELEEIAVLFNRPIKINGFALYDKARKKVAGEYFTSILQMAVVIHPDNPDALKEGTVLQAEWDITDRMGRTNTGTNRLPLKYVEH